MFAHYWAAVGWGALVVSQRWKREKSEDAHRRHLPQVIDQITNSILPESSPTKTHKKTVDAKEAVAKTDDKGKGKTHADAPCTLPPKKKGCIGTSTPVLIGSSFSHPQPVSIPALKRTKKPVLLRVQSGNIMCIVIQCFIPCRKSRLPTCKLKLQGMKT